MGCYASFLRGIVVFVYKKSLAVGNGLDRSVFICGSHRTRGTLKSVPYIIYFVFLRLKLYDNLIAAAAAAGFNKMTFKKTFYSFF